MIRSLLMKWAFLVLLAMASLAAPLTSHAQSPGPLHDREQAWSTWQQAVDALWLSWRAGDLPEITRQAIQEDLERFPNQLVQVGVMPEDDDHAWTEGCSAFEGALARATHEIISPMGVEGWREWRAVHRVMCGQMADERALVRPVLHRLGKTFLPPSPTISWESLVLDEIGDEDWACMRSEVPEALRLGLDRHEGLKHVARQCRLDPSLIFGDAQRCTGCLGHPRRPRQSMFQTWASRPLPDSGGTGQLGMRKRPAKTGIYPR